jgi:hypothetical protein
MKALLFLFILCFCSITSFAEIVPLKLNNHTSSEKLLNIEMIKIVADLFSGDQKAISTNSSLNTLQNNNDHLLLKDVVSDLSKKDNQVNYTCLRNLFNDILLCFRSSTNSTSLSACIKAAYATYLACK